MKLKSSQRLRVEVLESRLPPGDLVLSSAWGTGLLEGDALQLAPQTEGHGLTPPASISLIESVTSEGVVLATESEVLTDNVAVRGPITTAVLSPDPAADSWLQMDLTIPEAGAVSSPVVPHSAAIFPDSTWPGGMDTSGSSPASRSAEPSLPHVLTTGSIDALTRVVGSLVPGTALNPAASVDLPSDPAPDDPGLQLLPAEQPADPDISGLFNGTGPESDSELANVIAIDFRGPGNVNLRIDASTDIGSFGILPAGEDLEWVIGYRDAPNTTEAWDTTQSAPAAFLKGYTLSADVWVYSPNAEATSITILAINETGPYDYIEPVTVPLYEGWGIASVSSFGTVDTVDVNSLTFQWWLVGYSIEEEFYETWEAMEQTSHRIYTIHEQPVAPMVEPWATVLEVSSGLGRDLDTHLALVEQMTRGIHWSEWRNFRTTARFVDLQALFIYNPTRVRSQPTGPQPPWADWFTSQRFDLTNYMSFLSMGQLIQQCNDNTNIMDIFLASQGVPFQPLWFSRTVSGGPLVRTTYYPAGRSVTESYMFNFHQIGQFDGLVYDLSTRPAITGDPHMSIPFDTPGGYLDRAFPGQRPIYASRSVHTLTIGPYSGADFAFVSLSPSTTPRGTTVNVTLRGAGFDTSLGLRVVETGTTTTAAGVTLTNGRVVNANTITVDVTVQPTATPRNIQIMGVRGAASPFYTTRLPFAITA
jgi:hypothetical protein